MNCTLSNVPSAIILKLQSAKPPRSRRSRIPGLGAGCWPGTNSAVSGLGKPHSNDADLVLGGTMHGGEQMIGKAPDVLLTEDYATPRNPLGIKGAGESGITEVGAAIASAIDDALGMTGAVTQIPVTPQRMKAILRKRRRRV
jgi:hypothetical protein